MSPAATMKNTTTGCMQIAKAKKFVFYTLPGWKGGLSKAFPAMALALSLLPALTACHKDDKPTPAPPVKVEILEVGESGSIAGREYSGVVSSSESATVSFSVGGTISELAAKEGQKVNKGQLLGKIKNGDYLNAFNIAEAQLAEAQDGYNRLKKLHDANALPDVKWVEMQQKLKQAQNAYEMAKRTLDDASLYSPASGTVTRKFADVGQNVIPAQPIYEITSTKGLTADISLSENEIGGIAVGDKALVTIEAAGAKNLEGAVTQKSVTPDPLTRSYTVKVSIPDSEKILPGMLSSVSFSPKEGEGKEIKAGEDESISLPSQVVLLNHDNRWFVWVVNDSVAERRFVNINQLRSSGVTVTSGLRKGDKVIVAGMQKVGSGTRVTY